ncbi:MAG: peptide chain release factor N(5)-glutamine methyltransferase, partial [Chthoniobacterales bacterium]
LGTVEFHGRVFTCDARALVPRPETEQLVEIALEIARGRSTPVHILDIGTGSGVIALTLACELPGSEVQATDISEDALLLAAENAIRHEAAAVRFSHEDLLPSGAEVYDLIVANLPYIPTGEIASLAEEVRRDPHGALDGGADGLDLVRRLVDAAPGRLAPGGALLLEIGRGQGATVETLLASRKFRDISVRPDYQNIPRFAVGFHG